MWSTVYPFFFTELKYTEKTMTFVQSKALIFNSDFERLTFVNQCFVFMIVNWQCFVHAGESTPIHNRLKWVG